MKATQLDRNFVRFRKNPAQKHLDAAPLARKESIEE
jgi:hypothetical protein